MFFLQGILFGLMVAAPVGPMSLFCMHCTLRKGVAAGLFTGFGIACADFLYGGLAVSGFSFLQAFLHYQKWLRMGGGIFLACLGLSIFLKKPGLKRVEASSHGGTWFSAFGLTLSNPATILSFMALIFSRGLEKPGEGLFAPFSVALGIGVGSFMWWVAWVGLVSKAGKLLPDKVLAGVQLGSGLAFLAFAAACFF